ncbi:sugar phosphate isomerase/epimerase family protein [Macrococcus carouselicus]|uniref:Sugar phosphate isomerase/epimerase n=1 Tax=Macrococcus carouselicus TaxID=69969 RepID=A0A9Q8CF90_9STAP|nr:sugar phosphate isomerase/epimerase [Macrococcus carouselicus]TDL95503.1 sugar phosphate isomerase/epimerase [Macrococcus carouselicus]
MQLIINLDEISDDLDKSINFLKDYDINKCEIRLLNGNNIAMMNKDKLAVFKKKLDRHHITPIAIASPIFKWYKKESDEKIACVDSFGINTSLSSNEQDEIIDTVLENAKKLGIKKIRIFSYLKNEQEVGNIESYFSDEKVRELINQPYEFFIENELVCNFYSKEHLVNLSNFIDRKNIKNIKIWLDIANIYRNDEYIDKNFIKKIKHNIGYVHCKDYKILENSKKVEFVPLGDGIIDYDYILNLLENELKSETIVSIETHAPWEQVKYTYSGKSVTYFRRILEDKND